MSDLRWVIERLECEDWESTPFEGHCLRLTCKRCILERAEAQLAAATQRAEAAEIDRNGVIDAIGVVIAGLEHTRVGDMPEVRAAVQQLTAICALLARPEAGGGGE